MSPTPSRLILAWLAARTLAWTLVALTQANPPLDAVEWVAWGRHWQAGYHKHPPLAAWLAELASRLTPGSFAGVYLLGYLCVALALWCVWRVASDVLPPRRAAAATLCLDGLTYLTRDAAEYNNQVVLIAFWSLAVWCCWRTVSADRWGWWAATGAALGAALWCKYTAVLLALSLGAFWLWHARGGWSRVAVVAGTCAVVFLPHVVWLIGHDFVTLRYASERVSGDSDALNHRASALPFLASQAVRLLPIGVVLLPLSLARRSSARGTGTTFLLFAVVGPVVLHVAASVVLGMQLRDIWGVPLWTFAGVLICSWLTMTESDGRWRLFLVAWSCVALAMLGVTLAGNLVGGEVRAKPLRVHYPGRQLSREMHDRWRAEFDSPLPIAAGDWWLAACVCVHGEASLYGSREPAAPGMDAASIKGDPARFYAPDKRASPWLNDDEFRRRGGVLLWDADTFGDDPPPTLRARFPEARSRAPLHLPYAGTLPSSCRTRTLSVGWAVVPPGSSP